MNRFLKPPITLPNPHYFGGKAGSGTYQTIINYIRPHAVYVEPFAGNASIFRMKRPAQQTQLYDLNGGIVENLISGLENAGYLKADEGNFLKDTHQVCVRQRDALELLGVPGYRQAAPYGQRVFFLDPPYPLSSRKSPELVYTHELTDEDHVKLLTLAQGLVGDVLISTYPNALYAEMLRDWYRVEFQSQTRHGMATEWLFLNYDPAQITELHDYRYLGVDYRERERIAKKARRWTRMLQEMPVLERAKIIAHLAEAMPSGSYHR